MFTYYQIYKPRIAAFISKAVNKSGEKRGREYLYPVCSSVNRCVCTCFIERPIRPVIRPCIFVCLCDFIFVRSVNQSLASYPYLLQPYLHSLCVCLSARSRVFSSLLITFHIILFLATMCVRKSMYMTITISSRPYNQSIQPYTDQPSISLRVFVVINIFTCSFEFICPSSMHPSSIQPSIYVILSLI